MISRVIAVAFVVAVCLPSLAAHIDLEKQLNQHFRGKRLTLRHADVASTIKFDANGTPIGAAGPEYWYENAQFLCARVVVTENEVAFEGTRVELVFNSDSKDFDRVTTDRGIRVTVEKSASTTFDELLTVLAKVFMKKGEIVADVAPEYWRRYFCRELNKGKCAAEESSPSKDDPWTAAVYEVKDGVKAPRVVASPQPQYPEAARKAGLEAASLLTIIIETDGRVKYVQVKRPAGHGFDDAAAVVVKNWRFAPATKDGVPVRVRIGIEVNFRLFSGDTPPAGPPTG